MKFSRRVKKCLQMKCWFSRSHAFRNRNNSKLPIMIRDLILDNSMLISHDWPGPISHIVLASTFWSEMKDETITTDKAWHRFNNLSKIADALKSLVCPSAMTIPFIFTISTFCFHSKTSTARSTFKCKNMREITTHLSLHLKSNLPQKSELHQKSIQGATQ